MFSYAGVLPPSVGRQLPGPGLWPDQPACGAELSAETSPRESSPYFWHLLEQIRIQKKKPQEKMCLFLFTQFLLDVLSFV